MGIKIHHAGLAVEIASDLLKIGAIKINPRKPFVWTSGWKCPIYCDNRLSLSFPATRSKIKTALGEVIRKEFSETDGVAGVATAGIPHGVLVADELGLPFIYVRSKSKEHGLQNRIEGKIYKGQKIVLVEDLISTGGSALVAMESLNDVGAEVVGIIAIFTYGFQVAEDNFKDIKLVVLSDYHHLLGYAQGEHLFENNVLTMLKAWRKDPHNWVS